MGTMNSSATHLLRLSLLAFLIIATEATPTYSAHVCTDGTSFQPNSTFQTNLNLLLSSLTSNASLHGLPDTPSAINGLFLCRGDVNSTVCQDCVTVAAKDIILRCPNQTESIIWYDVCMLRYSNNSFNDIVPGTYVRDPKNVSSSEPDRFNQLLSKMLSDLKSEAITEKKFATTVETYTTSQNLYGLAQCTPDSSSSLCDSCFQSAIAFLPTCCDGSQGSSVLLPACNIRYALFPFFNVNETSSVPVVPPPSGKRNFTIVAIVVPVVVSIALLILGFCFLRKRASKKYNTTMEDGIGLDLASIDSLHFDLSTIEAATSNFSNEYKIGQGGFGVVFKGVLPSGQEIAVKRLSVSSLQGTVEFKTEAALVVKLQNRNLERLLRPFVCWKWIEGMGMGMSFPYLITAMHSHSHD